MDILRFSPILKTVVWGGERIAPFKGIQTTQTHIGESWELSGVSGNVSVVEGGPYDGATLDELIRRFGARLVGRFAGEAFPLLVKFIDAAGDLSIQVHPDDALAARLHGPGFRGKTEMWYVVDAAPGAFLYAGLSQEITPSEYERRVADGTITEVLARHAVAPGDVFYLPAGRVHAICSGCFIAEIQQSSDLTYRIFDYNRPGLDGKPRELHTDKAREAIDYTVYPSYRTPYRREKNRRVELVRCPFFMTSLYEVDAPLTEDISGLDSFLVVICVEGSGTVESDDCRMDFRRGETLLIPAENRSLRILPDGPCRLLTTTA